jgi:hypothetical protein
MSTGVAQQAAARGVAVRFEAADAGSSVPGEQLDLSAATV